MTNDRVLLKQLTGQVIELIVRYHPVGSFTVFGRVRHVLNGDTMWVGSANFSGDIVVRVCPVEDKVEYFVELNVKESEDND